MVIICVGPHAPAAVRRTSTRPDTSFPVCASDAQALRNVLNRQEVVLIGLLPVARFRLRDAD